MLISLIFVIGCITVPDMIEGTKELENDLENNGWKIYRLNATSNCMNYEGWEYLSRLTDNESLCMKYGKSSCFISMLRNYTINREHCNFKAGDIIYIYP